ncbi:MAG TPA: redoxin family protein [Gaiellaceae bacterium]|nr:redoxin family protein [Gaiellaceae bacterium]
MIVLVPIAFAAGVITVFTPCILPVLPIVLAGGPGTKRRPYAIAAGVVTTFTAFLLAGAWLWGLLGIGKQHQIQIGAVLLGILALTLLIPRLGEWAERPLAFMTRFRFGDLGGGFLLGASLGLVFIPCGGPVLAALTSNVARDRVGGWLVVVALAYAIGAALPLLAIAAGSRRVTAGFRQHAQAVRIGGGVLMAAAAVVIYNGWAESLQTRVPSYAHWLQDRIEDNGQAKDRLAHLSGRNDVAPLKPAKYVAAPDFQGITAWLNTRPLTLHQLRGKVVLVDFWTYSCINCLRTLPYLKSWDARYRSKGLVIVGVHSPEFAFEHSLDNVRTAVKRLGIRYPVALDTDFATWNAYNNQYWPADYLVDRQGRLRDVHFGEGDYTRTEREIRTLLATRLPPALDQPDRTPTELRTPESYLGYTRIGNYGGSALNPDEPATYTFPRSLLKDSFAYDGTWDVQGQRIVAGNGARLRLRFLARSVHLVLTGNGDVQVKLNGRALRTVHVTADKLYTLATQKRAREGLLELSFTPGLSAYAFTFG